MFLQDMQRWVDCEVKADDGTRALYATDASNYRQIPVCVVFPKTKKDIVSAVSVCHEHGVPITPRGGGTSLAGQCCNVAAVFDYSRYMNHVLELNPQERYARVQPGTVLDVLRDKAEAHHLTFAPDPATHNHCTLGGMIGNNSCGVHSVMGGRTADNIEELEVLTYDGHKLRVGATPPEEKDAILRAGGRRAVIYRKLDELQHKYADLIREKFPAIPRRVSGYCLDQLLPENGFNVARALVGTEGTCVTVLEAKTRLVPSPREKSLLVLGYKDIYQAGDHIPEVLEAGPVGLEGIDSVLVKDMSQKHLHEEDVHLLPQGHGWLLAEFGGDTRDEADDKARRLMERLERSSNSPHMKLFDDPEEEHKVWLLRESGLGATANLPGKSLSWEGWEDAAVPPDRVGAYLRDFRKLLNEFNYRCALYGHFGQGCIHTRINFDLFTRHGVEQYRHFVERAADLVASYGGSFSGEHGDGQSRAELLPKMYGPELVKAFGQFKEIWDPEGKMNPGKVVRPYRLDENLRLGPHYDPPVQQTHFKYPHDNHSFARAALRCVGVGECLRDKGGTMCPSYRVTRDEKHSTRGRAHLLFEMIQGDVVKNGWKDEHVKEALDLCLACKGCKGDCPVNVDMATYKAEFLSHYYKGKLRPRSAYAMGLIHRWAPLGAALPRLSNFFTQTPGLRDVAKAVAGMAPQRRIPPFANQNLRDWFSRRKQARQSSRKVILWPDTFNNYFHPEVGKAAVRVLEAVGYEVSLPRTRLCCGRPLYDYGMLDTAKKLLRETLDGLSGPIAEGVPVIGLEPSCVAVFRDELTELFPTREHAKRLRDQTFTLTEFLCKEKDSIHLPTLPDAKAVLHGHCHQKAVMGMQADRDVLGMLGVEYEFADIGCCGMAGSFGFEKTHYDTSIAVADHELVPRLTGVPKETILVADGFSCREQMVHALGRRPLHMAEVADLVFRTGQRVEGKT